MSEPVEESTSLWAQRLAIAGGLALVVFALYAAQAVLVPIALALLLCFLLTPVCNRLEHFGVPRVVATILMMLVVVGILGGLLTITYGGLDHILENRKAYRDTIITKVESFGGGPSFLDKIKEAQQVVEDVTDAAEGDNATTQPATQPTTQPAEEKDNGPQFGGLVASVNDVGEEVEDVQTTVDQLGTSNNPIVTEALPVKPGIVDQVGGLLDWVGGPIGTAGLTAVFTLFILLERDRLRDKVLRLASGGRLNIATQAIEEAGTRISRYLVAQAIVNGSYGLVVAVGLNVISYLLTGAMFPSWPLWAVLCAVLRFIPYVGPWIGAILPMLVSLGEYNGFVPFLWVAGMFIVIELWSNNVMEPWLYGSSTGISPVGVLFAATFWTWLWGVEGLVLSTPLTVCLVVLGKYVPHLKFFDILLREEDVLNPATRMYQRLLARDEDEVFEIAEDYVDEHSLGGLFDDVLMPALSMAEQDRHRDALSEQRQAFVFGTVRKLVHTFSERQAALREDDRESDGEEDSSDASPATVSGTDGSRVVPHAIVLPARDEADELAGEMLAVVMGACGYRVTVMPEESLVTEMESMVRTEQPAAVVLSAVPPAALTHARYLVKKLADDLGEARLIVALWTSTADRKHAREQLPETSHLTVARNTGEVVEAIRQAAQTQAVSVPNEDCVGGEQRGVE